MTTRYRNPDNHNDMVECPMGEYVRYEDYAKVCAALKPLADKGLYPDDIGAGFTDEDATDDSLVRELERLGFGTDGPINGADVVEIIAQRFGSLKTAAEG